MSQKTEEWRGKSLTEKGAAVVDRAHAPPMQCVVCGAKVMPTDARSHRMRCEGRPEAHSLDVWESQADTMGKGIDHDTLARLILAKALRWRERNGAREFLVRDVEQFVDSRRLFGATWS